MSKSCIASRVDRRTLAALASYFFEHQQTPRTISQLVNAACEHLLDILVSNKKAARIDSMVDADKILRLLALANKDIKISTSEITVDKIATDEVIENMLKDVATIVGDKFEQTADTTQTQQEN